MLDYRLRRCPNIKPTLGQYIVLAMTKIVDPLSANHEYKGLIFSLDNQITVLGV